MTNGPAIHTKTPAPTISACFLRPLLSYAKYGVQDGLYTLMMSLATAFLAHPHARTQRLVFMLFVSGPASGQGMTEAVFTKAQMSNVFFIIHYSGSDSDTSEAFFPGK